MYKSFILNDWALNYNNAVYKTSITCLNKNIKLSSTDQLAIFETSIKKYYNFLNDPIIYIPSMGYKFAIYADNKLIYSGANSPESRAAFNSRIFK